MVQDGSTWSPADPEVRDPFRRVWWLPVVRGLCFVVLGLLLMIEPLEQLDLMRVLVGAFLVLDALLLCVQWFVHRRQEGSAWWLAQAGVNVAFGAGVAFWPDLEPTPLYYGLASWAIVLGVTAVVGGVALARNRDLGWPWMVTFGLTATLFGVLLVTRPLDALDVLRLVTIVFALFAFVVGVIHLVSGFAVRSLARELQDLRREAARAGVVVTGGSVLGAANPHVATAATAVPGAPGSEAGEETDGKVGERPRALDGSSSVVDGQVPGGAGPDAGATDDAVEDRAPRGGPVGDEPPGIGR